MFTRAPWSPPACYGGSQHRSNVARMGSAAETPGPDVETRACNELVRNARAARGFIVDQARACDEKACGRIARIRAAPITAAAFPVADNDASIGGQTSSSSSTLCRLTPPTSRLAPSERIVGPALHLAGHCRARQWRRPDITQTDAMPMSWTCAIGGDQGVEGDIRARKRAGGLRIGSTVPKVSSMPKDAVIGPPSGELPPD